MTFFMKCCVTLLLAVLICGCGTSPVDVNADNDLWIVETPSSFCVADPEIHLDYCANDAKDPEYRFWLDANDSDAKRQKWMVKL